MRVIGLDPGLRRTGWGIVDVEANRLRHVANGVIAPDPDAPTAARLMHLHDAIAQVLRDFSPDEAAVEHTLANRNAVSTMKLGMARGTAMLASALGGLPVSEYMPTSVKKAVVGTGQATKDQVAMMVGRLLPGTTIAGADAADALAVAVCHAHSSQSLRHWKPAGAKLVGAGR